MGEEELDVGYAVPMLLFFSSRLDIQIRALPYSSHQRVSNRCV